MQFLQTLQKDKWTIYVYAIQDERYMIEYSDDGFGSKVRKEYDSKDDLLKMLNIRFPEQELLFLLNRD